MKIKLAGVGITAVTGTLGDDVFSRNQWGPYARKKGNYPNNLPWLNTWHNTVNDMVNHWQSTLTDAQRTAWLNATGYKIDALAQRKALSGFQLFMRVNLNVAIAGGALVTLPPVLVTVPILSGLSIAYNTLGVLQVNWNAIPGAGQWRLMIYASPTVSTGRMSPVQPFAFMDNPSAGLPASNFFGLYVAHYGAINPGFRIWCKIILVNAQTGQRANPHFLSVITT
jgi:hypothetical protein